MTERMIIEAHWGYKSFVLKSGVLAEKGKLACLDTANPNVITKGAVSTTLIPFGVFSETKTGDGTAKIQVKLFREIQAIWWVNDTVAPVVNVPSLAYIKDDQTVSSDGTSRSTMGFVLAVDANKGVLVFADYGFVAVL
jgi:hypothetical protein